MYVVLAPQSDEPPVTLALGGDEQDGDMIDEEHVCFFFFLPSLSQLCVCLFSLADCSPIDFYRWIPWQN